MSGGRKCATVAGTLPLVNQFTVSESYHTPTKEARSSAHIHIVPRAREATRERGLWQIRAPHAAPPRAAMVEIEEENELSVTELKRMKEAEVITGTCQHTVTCLAAPAPAPAPTLRWRLRRRTRQPSRRSRRQPALKHRLRRSHGG